MDKNNVQKVKDFFRKEGFYVVLFLCLCIVTTLGTVYFKKSRNLQTDPKKEENNKEISLNVDDKDVSNNMQNAERVENTTNKNTEKTTAVSNTTEVKFVNPISGTLIREFKTTPQIIDDEGNQRVLSGVNIKSKIGSEVKAAAEGVVETVGVGDVEEGTRVVIKHANGLKTVYANLDPKVNVKTGDKVTSSTIIGKVGNTVKIFGDKFGEFLNIQVINSQGKQVDPLKYFSYSLK